MNSLSISSELRAAAECSWLPASAAGLSAQKASLLDLLGRTDPAALCALFRRHRVEFLAKRVLETHGLLERLGAQGLDLARRNGARLPRRLALARAEGAVRTTMLASAIPFSILKGATLSHRIYGDPVLRHSKDIDLLVAPDRLWETVELLESEGWVEEHPRFPRSGAYLRLLRHRWYHLEFHRPGKGLHLEIHWHVEALPGSRFDRLWVPELLAARVDMPLTACEFLYLCAHGEHHTWMRLKWLGDLRAVLDRHPGLWAEAWELAPSLGMRAILRQVAGLLEVLYGHHLDVPPADPDTTLLVGAALRTIESDRLFQIPWANGLKGWRSSRRYAAISRRRFGWWDRLRSSVLQALFSPGDMLLLRLPGWLLWLLPVIRLPLLVARPFSPALRRKLLEAYGHA